MIGLMALATYVIPAGEYERVESPDGREMIDPASYKRVEQTPVDILGLAYGGSERDDRSGSDYCVYVCDWRSFCRSEESICH